MSKTRVLQMLITVALVIGPGSMTLYLTNKISQDGCYISRIVQKRQSIIAALCARTAGANEQDAHETFHISHHVVRGWAVPRRAGT